MQDQTPLRIGVMIRDIDQLENWECRILDEIRCRSNLELCLLIKDGRPSKPRNYRNLLKLFTSKTYIEKILFMVQSSVETKVFGPRNTVNRDRLKQYLDSIPTISLSPLKAGFLDKFSAEDAQSVKEYELDIIIRHEFNIIRGDILNAAKYGVWSFHHGDNTINRGSPAGFWEIVLNQPVIGVTLQKLTPELDGGLVIDKGFYNRHWSYMQNRTQITEESVTILFKNIERLQAGRFEPIKSTVYYNPLYRVPSVPTMLKYMFGFYTKVLNKRIRGIVEKVSNVKYDRWTLFIGKKDFLSSTLFRLKPVNLPKNEFWADPFMVENEGCHYVFFENYCYKKQKGKISCGRIEKRKIVDVQDVFDLDYHLSYPFLVREEGKLFMIPESSGAKRVDVYECIEFPHKWKLYSRAFEGEVVADTTYYKDPAGQSWLFLNKSFNDDKSANLYIYKVDSLKLNKIEAHKQNPVVIDSRVARCAGSIFERDGEAFRPSQNNSNGVYGFGLNINKIKVLNLEEYEEELVTSIQPNFHKDLKAVHHLHQHDNLFVLDGCMRKM